MSGAHDTRLNDVAAPVAAPARWPRLAHMHLPALLAAAPLQLLRAGPGLLVVQQVRYCMMRCCGRAAWLPPHMPSLLLGLALAAAAALCVSTGPALLLYPRLLPLCLLLKRKEAEAVEIIRRSEMIQCDDSQLRGSAQPEPIPPQPAFHKPRTPKFQSCQYISLIWLPKKKQRALAAMASVSSRRMFFESLSTSSGSPTKSAIEGGSKSAVELGQLVNGGASSSAPTQEQQQQPSLGPPPARSFCRRSQETFNEMQQLVLDLATVQCNEKNNAQARACV